MFSVLSKIRLEGKKVYLEEVCPMYFPHIIEWRNDPKNNQYLNQPYTLTLNLQKKWFYEKYVNDNTQGLLVMIDKDNNIPFGTIGWTNYDEIQKVCIGGRLLVGNTLYRGSIKWKEATLIYNTFIYNNLGVHTMYSHIVNDNIASIKWHKKWGFVENKSMVLFPEELVVNGMAQTEYYRTYDMYFENVIRTNKFGVDI